MGMDITWNLVRDVLAPYGAQCVLRRDERDLSFRMISYLPQDSSEDLDGSVLYVFPDPLQHRWIHRLDHRHTLVTTAGEAARPILDSARCNLVLLDPSFDFARVCNDLNRCIRSLWEWELELERVLGSSGDLQAILDASEHLFHNPILIMSKSLQLVAYTRNIAIPDPDLRQTVEQRSFPHEMVQYLVRKGHLSTIESFHEIGITPPDENFVKCSIVTRAFGPNPLRINTVSLYGLHAEPTPGEVDLVRFLSTVVERFTQMFDPENPASDRKSEYFVLDLLERKLSDREAEIKSEIVRLPFRARYRLYCLHVGGSAESHANYVLGIIHSLQPYVVALQYDGMVLLLDNEDLRGEKGREEFRAWLLAFLADNQAVCGVSRQFGSLAGAAGAFEQAKSAVLLGGKLHPERKLYPYDEYYVYDLVAGYRRGVEAMCIYREQLEAIAERDRKRGSNNLELLHALLKNERNITDVSHQMHLHRNSVLYRLERIEEMLGMKLDDPVERLILELSIRAFQLMQAEKEAE